jgi:hypothetical protein
LWRVDLNLFRLSRLAVQPGLWISVDLSRPAVDLWRKGFAVALG